jgi:two-component system, NtrC family, nitrogen regulation sensor histidine kinase NtrY
MNDSRAGTPAAPWIRQRRYYYIVFFIVILLLLLEGVRAVFLVRIESEWDALYERQAAREAAVITDMFGSVQQRTARIADHTAGAVESFLHGRASVPPERTEFFELLRGIGIGDLQGVEVYAADGSLVAWMGRGTGHRTNAHVPDGRTAAYSVVSRGAVFTTLTVVRPVQAGDTFFYAAAHEIFDVQYVLSPRFIQMQGLHRDLREALGKRVDLLFNTGYATHDATGDAAGDAAGDGYYRVPLRGVGGSVLGYAHIAPPVLEAYVAGAEEVFHTIRAFLIAALSILLIAGIVQRLRQLQFPAVWAVAAIGVIWAVRYVWLELAVPETLFGGTIFDPVHFASPFGGGIVASPGELLLTGLLLLATALLLFHSVIINNSLKLPEGRSAGPRWVLVVGAAAAMGVYMGLIRSYAATVRSIVFDSSVRFTDPGSLFPSPMLALMQLNLLVVTAGFVVLGTVLGYIVLRLVQGGCSTLIARYGPVLLLLLAVTGTAFYFMQNSPLIGIWYYLAVPCVLIGVTVLVQKGFLQSFRLYKIRSILFLTGVSVLFAAPVLNKNINDLDREQIQFIANTVVRPTDTWKEFLLHQSLWEFQRDERLIRMLEAGDVGGLEPMAFQLWAGSMLGREGYNTTVEIYDADESRVSRFSIGFQPGDDVPVDRLAHAAEPWRTYIRDVETVHGAAMLYASAADVTGEEGETIGTVAVRLVTGPGTLFRGYGPDILQTHVSPDIAARYGRLVISEFRGRTLASTSALNMPEAHEMPPRVYDALRENAGQFIWARERIEGKVFETAYFQDPYRGQDAYIAISVPLLNLRWHAFYALKLIFFALAVSGCILVAAGIVFYLRGKRYEPTFKEKILIGLLSISLIPIVIVAYLNREFTIESMTEHTSRQLHDEARRIAVQLERYEPRDTGEDGISQAAAERLAAELGVDFILYRGGYVSSTSRLEMFEAELMDKRISGYAYLNIVLQGKNFITREEAIGQTSYLVGYLPLRGDEGGPTEVLAVPAIYRQTEIVEEIARRDAFLFGIYAVVMLGIVCAGLIVANRVSRPIENLTEATKKVAGGELDIRLESRGGSEISNLMQSFNIMTKRLKESREELARVERELAWREMARQVAHEIKNPLTPMKLSIQHLRQERKDRAGDFNEAFEKVTQMLLEQIEALDRIASEFSRFARMPLPRFEPVDVHDLLRRTISVFPQKEGVDFQSEFADTIPVVYADPDELQRAFINIIRNSIQAMPEGGTLDISTRITDGRVRIRFHDTGSGIRPEVRKRLFEPNFSTKTEGMGLGLAIVKKAIEEMDGTIAITSEMNSGTSVDISLPVAVQSDNKDRKEPA